METGTDVIAHAFGGTDRPAEVEYAEVRRKPRVNVNTFERILSGIAGVLFLRSGFRRFSRFGLLKAAAGAALIRRGMTGHCACYEALGTTSAIKEPYLRPGASKNAIEVQGSITVDRTRQEAYELWRDPRNQPWIMGRFAKMTVISPDHATWAMRSPLAATAEWDTLIVDDRPGELIRWESMPGGDLPNEGTVYFLDSEDGVGCEVVLQVRFDPPAGSLGLGVARLMGISPEKIISTALRRFKTLVESGQERAPTKPHPLQPRA